jgi:hypothetical protein
MGTGQQKYRGSFGEHNSGKFGIPGDNGSKGRAREKPVKGYWRYNKNYDVNIHRLDCGQQRLSS